MPRSTDIVIIVLLFAVVCAVSFVVTLQRHVSDFSTLMTAAAAFAMGVLMCMFPNPLQVLDVLLFRTYHYWAWRMFTLGEAVLLGWAAGRFANRLKGDVTPPRTPRLPPRIP